MSTQAKRCISGLFLIITLVAVTVARAELTVKTGTSGTTGAIDVPPPESGAQAGQGASGGQDVLLFMNKDKLHGRLLAVSPDKFGLQWQHPEVKKAIEMSLDGISEIGLSSRSASARRAHAATVRLTNDDILNGDIVSLDGDKLIMDTWYAGRIEIVRSMLKLVSPNSGSGPVTYEGPKDIKNWKFGSSHSSGSKSWALKNGSLYALRSSQTIARNIDSLGDMSSLEFRASWRGYPQFYFAFYTDNLQNYYGNCYMLQVSGSSVYLQRYSKRGNQRNLGNVNVQKFNNSGGSSVFRMLVDKKKKQFTLTIDGTMIKQWTDTAEFAGMGKGILFRPQTQGGLKISNIRVADWDGKIPQAIGEGGKEEADTIRFANNDKVSGTLGSIKSGVAKFKTAYATLDIPVERIGEIEMSSTGTERARRNKEDVRARFVGGGASITLRLTELADGKLHGISENCGSVEVPVSAFEMLEFNIYKEKSEKDDDSVFF